MLKVQVLYKLSMYETDWTMTAEEYSEFIASTQGLPRPLIQKSDPVLLEDIPWHGTKTPSLVKDQEIARLHKLLQERESKIDEMNAFYEGRDTKRIWELEKQLEAITLTPPGDVVNIEEINKLNEEYQKLTGQIDNLAVFIMNYIPGEPSRSEGAIDTAIRLLKIHYQNNQAAQNAFKEFLNQPAWRPKDPRDLIEVPNVVEIVPIVSEKVQEKPKKAIIEPDDKFKAPSSLNTSRKKPGKQGRDYTKHLKMLDNNDPVNDIVKVIMEDFNLTKATAQSTYNNIKRTHERRKVNQNMLDSKEKVSVIPSNPVTIVKPSNSKIPRNLREEIACMPEYDNPINFKDAIITREYCNLYDIATLKAYYKETHENIKW